MNFRVFKKGNLTGIHRPGVIRFELELGKSVLVGTIKEIKDVASADWNVGLIPMKLVFVDLLIEETLESWAEGVFKHGAIENALWMHGDTLANWMVEGELVNSMPA